MRLAREERADLADLLASLTPAQWDAPSLCAGWRVRDVVAHMFSYEELSPVGLVMRFVRGGILPGRVNGAGVAAYAGHSPADLLALVRDHQQPRGLTAGFGGRIALTDGVIHHQDVRRPLGLPREIPADRLRVALDFARTAPTIGAAKRVRGLTLAATDLDWSAGTGPVVEGPAESLLMAIAGRRGAARELTGPGRPVLAARLPG
ncbi:maleylpyruvate isomerase family mycothiol-dependent enzyme [Pseudonocardia sp. KRD-184]|uniref:Maleylpyruvate isomerase family mycothiol-dependent enzyme n=1 Tax=Pseudonocardia oceani TaxID=2792013 RepID=A0ABS6U7I8_9PSEU|nr:maleylpyruvate isomerase family mycothiol-dependent enzyme [Pseudonocardia oceani]MBW0088972.1 maleylpyruvate isomerase family mycothiol-dependent enzyme [Pseudonocardia oceani]MBW0095723.1 maleylpyruvate isomerase family mycothiol-dependent enzyme [Pseudonocardia oceani]MBW0108532.1 maleylpyruvate isomerase family mycothiol-dependent enzyme [Pseudonocardia oceani]MBW0121917.1 maleylpyruvate isomerase family mycothiol-dependent enzyme [Pseudonocardia oceani]MBW0128197.1 maleylpyruvate isome